MATILIIAYVVVYSAVANISLPTELSMVMFVMSTGSVSVYFFRLEEDESQSWIERSWNGLAAEALRSVVLNVAALYVLAGLHFVQA